MVELTRPITADFLAFISDESSLKATRALASGQGWDPEGCIFQGDVETAITHLAHHPTPKTLLVEVPGADAAPELLDRLADVCAPSVRVIVASRVNEFSFFSWLMEVGIHAYLLEPFTEEQLKKALEKEVAGAVLPPSQAQPPGKLIVFMGTRGGVGTTTILSNLAYLMDKEYHQTVAVLDMDMHFGTVAMAFDLEPVRGLGVLFEQPDRIDGLFLDRVSAHFSDGLSLVSAEEPLKNTVTEGDASTEALIVTARQKYRYVLVDLPRTLTPMTRRFLHQADAVVLVSELTLLGLRDLIRLTDYLKEQQKTPIVVANREGLASKHELPKKDFEKHYGNPIHTHIPCMMEAFATSATGEMLIETTKNSAGLTALHHLAEALLGEDAKTEAVPPKEKKRLSWRQKGKE